MKEIMVFDVNKKNPYDYSLYQQLEKDYGFKPIVEPTKKLSIGDFYCDALQIMWPQSNDIDGLKKALGSFNGKIICFVHNLKNHNGSKATEVAYNYATDFVHLGSYSLNLFKEKFPDKRHWLLPHHVYDTIYNLAPKKVNFGGYKTLLFFGRIRYQEETEIINSLKDFCLKNNYRILVCPGQNFQGEHILNVWQKYLSEQQLMDVFHSCDIIFCPRVRNLNSSVQGDSLFGKPIIGPGVGNIKEFLELSGNYVYYSADQIPDLINEAYENRIEIGNRNLEYSKTITTKITADKLMDIYRQLDLC